MKPITQKDIARVTGLSTAAVSMAFRNHPGIPAGTRRRVMEMGEKMGYRRDPMLGALSAYRLKHRPAGFHGVIAWLYSSATGLEWQRVTEFRAYYQGACEKAALLGYQIEQFDLNLRHMSPTALARVLHSRGIRGALVCPMPRAHSALALPLDQFAVVALGYTVETPPVHRVSSHHYDSMMEIIQQLRGHGYRRIACCIPSASNERTRGSYFAAFLSEQQNLPPEDRIPLYTDGYHHEEFASWLDYHRPEVVITSRHTVAHWPENLRRRVPQDFCVAVVSTEDDAHFAGVNECSKQIGATAAQFLISLVERGEAGVPELPQHLLIKARWHSGQTLAAVPPGSMPRAQAGGRVFPALAG